MSTIKILNAEDMRENINNHMTGGGCPKKGCIGECAFVEQISVDNDDVPFWMAYLYIWDDQFNDLHQVAKWFIDAGAMNVTIAWVLYDPLNNNRDGFTEDGVRVWHATYA